KLRITDIDTRYNRRIGEVYLLDGTFIQHSLVKEGLALIYYDYFSKCPREMAISLLLAEADAERQGKGLWQEPKSGFIEPWLFRPLKKKQKALLADPDEYQQLTEKIQTLCEDLEAGNLTKDQFEDTFKQTLK
ncbi:MAG: thermonuclease family protein, partial [Moorea sp. SIO3E2]|nr:thermonuclease family protein [Moorena sp. SIO3E2]